MLDAARAATALSWHHALDPRAEDISYPILSSQRIIRIANLSWTWVMSDAYVLSNCHCGTVSQWNPFSPQGPRGQRTIGRKMIAVGHQGSLASVKPPHPSGT